MERRTTQVVVAGAAVAAGLVAAGVVVASGGSADESAPVATTQTATVERRTLTAAETRDGTVGFADESTLQTQRQGVLTALAAAGATKRRGDVLFRVNQEPTVLLYGAIPAYRPMAEGTSGRDVKQLERNLKALDSPSTGHSPATPPKPSRTGRTTWGSHRRGKWRWPT